MKAQSLVQQLEAQVEDMSFEDGMDIEEVRPPVHPRASPVQGTEDGYESDELNIRPGEFASYSLVSTDVSWRMSSKEFS